MSDKTVSIKIRNVFGNQNAYPECENGKLFLQLTGKKTFSTHDIGIIQQLGFTVKFHQQSIEDMVA